MGTARKPYGELSLLDFQNRFPTEESCWVYLVQMRWPKGYRCPDCSQAKVHFKPSTHTFQCYECDRHTSVTAGTLFHKSHLPLRKWFWAIFLMATSSKGISMRNLQKHLGIKTYRAVWMMGHKIRRAMGQRDALYPLKDTVQVDQFAVGGQQTLEHRRRTRRVIKSPFLIAIQEGQKGNPRFVKFNELESGFKEHVLPLLEKTITKGSRLKSDEAGVFLAAEKHGYQVDPVAMKRYPDQAKEHLKWAFVLASNVKRGLLSTYHGCFPKYRKAYLSEFAYRFNRRYWPHQAFDRLLFACLNADKITLRQLKA
jgi:transposase-like protein